MTTFCVGCQKKLSITACGASPRCTDCTVDFLRVAWSKAGPSEKQSIEEMVRKIKENV